MPAVQKIYGISLQRLPLVRDEEKRSTVPEILFELRKRLVAVNGLDEEGIFRVSAHLPMVEKWIAKVDSKGVGCIKKIDDPHLLSALLKRWFERLPERLLTGITSNTTETDIPAALAEPGPSTFRYMVKFLADVAAAESSKMTGATLAIIFAPCMGEECGDDMMSALEGSRIVTELLTSAINNELNRRGVPIKDTHRMTDAVRRATVAAKLSSESLLRHSNSSATTMKWRAVKSPKERPEALKRALLRGLGVGLGSGALFAIFVSSSLLTCASIAFVTGVVVFFVQHSF